MHFNILIFSLGVMLCTLGLHYISMHPYVLVLILLGLAYFLGIINTLRLCCYITLGVIWVLVYEQLVNSTLPHDYLNQNSTIRGYITSPVKQNKSHQQFLFAMDQICVGVNCKQFSRKVDLRWYGSPLAIAVGDRWQFVARLKAIRQYANPGSFAYEDWSLMHGISAIGYIKQSQHNKLLSHSAWSYAINQLRAYLNDGINQALVDHELKGMIAALSVGIKDNISWQQWQVLQRTGTIHLMAISGLHISLVAALAYGIVYRLWCLFPSLLLWRPACKAAAVAAIVAAVIYSALAGFALPTQRALVMTAMVLLVKLKAYYLKPSDGFCLALLIVLLLNPLSMLSMSFWLSFAAVACILYSIIGRYTYERWWQQALYIQSVLLLGLMPILLLSYGQVSLSSWFANMLAIPIVSFLVVPLALLGCLSYVISSTLSAWLWQLAALVLSYLWNVLSVLAELPYSIWHSAAAPWWVYLFAIVAVAALLLPRQWPYKYSALVLLLPLLLYKPQRPNYGDFTFTLLDVGQGLAAVIETAKHRLIYDTGAKYSDEYSMATAVLLPYLQHRGISHIDTLILSHGDNDHSGGVTHIINSFKVNEILSGEPSRIAMEHIYACTPRQWQYDGVYFELLAPEPWFLNRGNDSSCVLQVRSGEHSLLLTGDISKKQEQWLLQQYGSKLQSDILVVPHHGSKTSSSAPFVAMVNPRYALLPIGYMNRYGFPHKQIVEMYKQQGSEIYDTASSGALQFVVRPNKPIATPDQYRLSKPSLRQLMDPWYNSRNLFPIGQIYDR